MNISKTLLGCSKLPAYWRDCRVARANMMGSIRKEAYGSHRRQYAVIAEPPADKLRPGNYAFYFHGGAWTFGHPETFVPAAQPWLELGYRVVLPSYRRPPSVGLNRVVEDCRRAIVYFLGRETINDVQLAGLSAGAHLAALLATDEALWSTVGPKVRPSAVLACAGPLSFSDLKPRSLFLPRYAHLNPVDVLPAAGEKAPRWQLIHGTADGVVDRIHSRKFHDQLRAKGYRANLLELPDGSHIDAGRWMFGEEPARTIRDFIAATNDNAPRT